MDDGFAMGYALGQDSGGNKSGGGMFDGNGSWIWIIVVFALLFGWGNNGNGNGQGANNGNGGGCAMPAYIPYPAFGAGIQGALTRADLCSEFNFNNLDRAVTGISQGICDSTFALNNTITNGFNGVSSAVCNLGYEQAQLHNATQMAIMQGQNAVQTQIAQCCCDNRTGQMNIINSMERGFCQANYNDATNTTAIIQNSHNDTDRVLAKLDAMEMARKDETIASLRTQLAQCGDQSTANYIINQLTGVINPRPVPAYPAASPCGLGNWAPQVLANGWNGNCGCGCNSGCGC